MPAFEVLDRPIFFDWVGKVVFFMLSDVDLSLPVERQHRVLHMLKQLFRKVITFVT